MALVIHLHPMDVCKRLAVHFVNEQAALQVVHLVLDDACCPPIGLPHHLLSSGVQPWKEVTVWVKHAALHHSEPPHPFPAPGCCYLQETASEGNLDNSPYPPWKRCLNSTYYQVVNLSQL